MSKKHWVRNGNGNRKGTVSDIDELEQLYNSLIDHLTNTVNYPGWIKGGYPEVYTFAVHPMYLKKGIGKRHLDFAEEYGRKTGVKAIRLDVYEKNIPAVSMYRKCGYQYIDRVDLGYGVRGLDRFELYQKII